jgi:prepilin-type N-terminal cleavage/methylation domain-containing protein
MIRIFSSSARRPRGFSLIEVLACLLILGVLGAALTRMLLAQSRLYELQRAQRDARAVAQSSMNLLFSDLRMVHDGGDAPGGVMIASPETLSVRVPYAIGLVCGNGLGATTVSMLPADSVVLSMAKYAGFAWRDRVSGKYTYVPVVDSILNAPVTSVTPTTCTTTAKIASDTIMARSWGPLDLKPISAPAGLQPGAPVFFYHNVTYYFSASTAYPGRIGLWRKLEGRAADELMAPFDGSARFKFFVRSADTSTVAPPLVLDSLVGVSLVLTGSSPSAMAGRTFEKSRMETAVLFRNHPGF